MVVIVMPNAQMGVSYIERNPSLVSNYTQIPCFSCGFSISPRPHFGIFSNTKRAKIQYLVLKTPKWQAISALLRSDSDDRVGGSSSGILEKEFGFKPSFDEQLKIMESVLMKREKRKNDQTNKEDGLSSPVLEKDEENVKTRKSGGRFQQEKPSQDVPMKRFSRNTGEEGSFRGKSQEEVRVNKGIMDASKAGFSEPSLEKKGYVNNWKGLAQDTLNSKASEKKFNAERDGGDNAKNQRWLKYQTGSKEELDGSNLSKNVITRLNHGVPHAVENTGRSVKVGGGLRHDNKFSGMLERKESYVRQENDKLKGHALGIERQGFKNSEMHKRHYRNNTEDEKIHDQKFARKNDYFTKSRRTYNDKVEGKNLETERAAFKSFDVFNDVMDKPRVTRMETEERIQKLAKWLNGADINIPEWKFSKMIRSAKIKFTDHSVLRMIQILGKLGNWKRVLQVIEWLQMQERFKSHKLRYIYTAALDALGKARRPVEALNVFNAMQQQMLSYPDLVAYHCISIILGQAGHMKELFYVIDVMRSPPKKKFNRGVLEKWDPRLEPDLTVYNAVLNACVQRKQWEGAFWVLQQLKHQGQQPSSTTYGLLMEVMFVCGKYNLVHEFFRKVQKSTIPNALTYKVLVNTLWREGKTDEAILAVRDMERRGIVGSASLYYDLARCLCSAGRCREALMQIEKICRVANKPLVVTYTGLIQACLESGNIQDGAYIFSQMHKFCSPNLVTYNMMLKGYTEHGMFQEAKQLFQNMSKDGNHISSKYAYKDRVIPDIYTFNTMLDACFADKRWDDFGYFYKQMLHHGNHFNAKRHLRMILDASRSGEGELLEITWKHLAQDNRILPLPLITERFCMKLEKGDYAAAISCISSLPRSNSPALSKLAWLNLFKDNAHRLQKDTLVGLLNEVSILVGRSDFPDSIFQNLIASCKEFLRLHMNVSESNLTETVNTVTCKIALKF